MPKEGRYRYKWKYRSPKTGKYVYVYDDTKRPIHYNFVDSKGERHEGQFNEKKYSHSRKHMTDKERARDDRRHRSYNKKRMAKNAGNIFKNLGRAAKAVAIGKNAGKYLARSRKSALKTARNAINLATSYSGHTGKRTKAKAFIEKRLYNNKRGTPSNKYGWHSRYK